MKVTHTIRGRAENLTHEFIFTTLKSGLSEYVNIDEQDLDPNRGFDLYGLESFQALNFALEIEKRLGINIEPTDLWDYNTLDTLSLFLCQEADVEIDLPDDADELEKIMNTLS